jgi:hypothetical protein
MNAEIQFITANIPSLLFPGNRGRVLHRAPGY